MRGSGFDVTRGLAARLAVAVALAAAVPAALAASAWADSPPKVDVLFEVDTTGSMTSAIGEVKSEIADTMQKINAGGVADVEYGLAEIKDYPPGGLGDGWYGSPSDNPPDVPWTLRAPIGPASAVGAAAQAFTAEGGGDAPEAYGRALYEADTNPSIGWRPGARRFIVLIGDNVPHDPDLNAGVPAEYQTQPTPFDTHPDPGPDGIPGTADDISWQTELHRLSTDGIPLLFVYYHGTPAYLPYWSWWAGETGGSDVSDTGADQLESDIVNLVTQGETAPLPPCPSGMERDANFVCSAPPWAPSGIASSAPYSCTPLAGGGELCSPPTCASADRAQETGSPSAAAGASAAQVPEPPANVYPTWITDAGFAVTRPLRDVADVVVKPNCRLILAEGDSVTAGHNIDRVGTLLCEDARYSYPYWVWRDAQNSLKNPLWTGSPYINAAYSGFGTLQVLNGGDVRPCNERAAFVKASKVPGSPRAAENASPAPIKTITRLLQDHPQPAGTKIGQGNLVLQSVGINDADWPPALEKIITAQSKEVDIHGTNITFAGMDRGKCEDLLHRWWDPLVNKELPNITNRAADITRQLIAADPTVKIFWLYYYNFAGTGYLYLPVKLPWKGMQETITAGPLLPKGCEVPFNQRRDDIDKALRAGVNSVRDGNQHVQWVTSGSVLDGKGDLLQPVIGASGLKDALEKGTIKLLDTVEKSLEKGVLKAQIEAVHIAQTAVNVTEAAVKAAGQSAPQSLLNRLAADQQTLKTKQDALEQALNDEVNRKLDFTAWGLRNSLQLGWPHPNVLGQQAIAGEISKLLGL